MLKKCQIKLKRKWSVLNPQNYNSVNFNSENYAALKHYESTEVDRRTWLHVPLGTPWSTSSDTHQVVEIWKQLYRCAEMNFLPAYSRYNSVSMCRLIYNWYIADCIVKRDFYLDVYTILNLI